MTKSKAKQGARGPANRRPAPKGRARPGASKPRFNGLWIAAVVLASVVAVIAVTSRSSHRASPTTRDATAGVVGGDFHSLVADPTKPGRLFVGGHTKVSTSVDGGRTWSEVASLDGADAMAWTFAKDATYVSGHPGLNRSIDGAVTFRPANDALPDTDLHAFGAGTTTLYGAGPANGVIASTDGGKSWKRRTQDAGQSFFGRILVGPDDDEHLIAADARAGAAESTDGGRTWRPLGGPPSASWVSRSGTTVYASGPAGAGRTTDGGATWEKLTLPPGATLVEADPADPNTAYAGVHDGDAVRVWLSRDGGAHWARP